MTEIANSVVTPPGVDMTEMPKKAKQKHMLTALSNVLQVSWFKHRNILLKSMVVAPPGVDMMEMPKKAKQKCFRWVDLNVKNLIQNENPRKTI